VECFTKGKYLGNTGKPLEFEGNLLNITSYPSCPDSDWHYHENSFFTFVLNGGCVETRKTIAHETGPGDLLFYGKGIVHKNVHYQENSRNFNLELSDQWLKNYDVQISNDPDRFLLKKCDIKFLFVQLYQEYLDRDAVSPLSLNSILLGVMAHLCRDDNGNKIPSWVPPLREFVLDNWSVNFSLKELADVIHVHPVTISKNFSRYFGCTLGEFIRKYRIEKALYLIRTTELSLTDIAFTCGFADQSHFIRTFKKLTGTLPLHYRKI